MWKIPIQPYCESSQVSEVQFWNCICQNSRTCKKSSDAPVKKKSNGYILVKCFQERTEQHTLCSVSKAEISSVQVFCTEVSVDKFNHLSKLHLQFESFSTWGGANPLLCAKANLSEHIQKKLSLLNLTLVSFPMVRLTRGQEGKSTWSKLLTSLFLHTYSHKPLPSADSAGESLHFRSQPKHVLNLNKFGRYWEAHLILN